MKFINIEGHRYARLTVVRTNGLKNGRLFWLCRCDCGNEISISSNSLRQGNTKSCGCLAREKSSINGRSNRKHGESKCGSTTGQPSREYRAWNGLKERCHNPNNKDFAKYGGRGITVCKRWERFENFLADMGRCPPNHSIDRIDNDGGYNPDNCHWATTSEQNKNRRPLQRAMNGKFMTR